MPALWRDGYEAAQPLKFEIHESVELKFLFTDLMYKKSAAVMRMFASAYGETAFKAGLTVSCPICYYLSIFKDNNRFIFVI